MGIGGWFFGLGAVIFAVWFGSAGPFGKMLRPEVLPARAAVADNTRGFFDADTFGWISANCANDWNGDGTVALATEELCNGAGGAYGVNVETLGRGGTISGLGWSPNLGIVCFGSSCAGTAPYGSAPILRFDFPAGSNAAALLGWARAESHAAESGGSGGWIQFSGTSPGGTVIQVLARVRNVSGENRLVIDGSAWQGNSDGTGAGWLDVDISSSAVPLGVLPCPDFENECTDGGCCSNGVDDDCDASFTISDERDTEALTGVDCQDYDCAGVSVCPGAENMDAQGADASAQCFDGLDNDLDAYVRSGGALTPAVSPLAIDCADADCAGAVNPTDSGVRCVSRERLPGVENLCDDDLDNDGNGLVDCADPDCAEFVTCIAQNLCPGHERLAGQGPCPEGCSDNDSDLVCDGADNCLNLQNPDQKDRNDNGVGDACDAFLETRQGALYGAGLYAPAPSAIPNATFCVLSSGQIENFRSGSCALSASEQSNVQEFRLRQYPDTLVLWSNALRGYLALDELRRRSLALPASGEIVNWNALGVATTGGRIYYHRGDVTIDEQIIWQNGSSQGGRTILVEGNLTIRASSRYDATPLPSGAPLRALASVAWIVVDNPDTLGVIEGNIIIDAQVGGDSLAVGDIVGAYIASGEISTGTQGPLDLPLTARGLFAARSFAFDRQYADRATGAERIIYDGRAALNPPPGLADFVKGLPTFRTVVPQ